MKRHELTGKRFGKLTVTRFIGSLANANGKKFSMWEATCQCGETIQARGTNLTYGNTKSCGQCDRDKRHFLHGSSRSSEYVAYCDAIQRCTNPNNIRFERYGERGIKFLFTSFTEFIEHIGPRPEGFVLDRIDNDGNYEIGNVRWVTKSQSIRNSSKCIGRKRRAKVVS